MKTEFKEQAGKIYSEIINLLGKPENQINATPTIDDDGTIIYSDKDTKAAIAAKSRNWETELEYEIEYLELNKDKSKALQDAANFNLNINDSSIFKQRMSHAFEDSVLKSCNLFREDKIEAIDEVKLLTKLVQLKHAMHTNMHNYPLLLGEFIPEKIKDILDEYKKILPQIDHMITGLLDTDEINNSNTDINNIDLSGNGWEYISELTPDIFAP